MPTTRFFGKPVTRFICVTMASSGFETTITNAFGACCLMPSATLVMILALVASRSSRLMPGLRARPAVTMHDVGAGDVGVAVGAGDAGVEALDRSRLEEVERLPLRQPFDDVEEHDVAEMLQRSEVRERAADVAGPDEGDLLACHAYPSMLAMIAEPNSEQRSSFAPGIWRSRS